MTHFLPRGLITEVITPLNDKEELDREGLTKLLGTVTKENEPVLINSSYAGEGTLLSAGTRRTLIRETMSIIDGKVVLILGFTGDTAEEALENVKYIEDSRKELNYKGEILLFDCPLWYHSNRGLPDYYEKFSKFTSLPIILSNNPELILNLRKHLKRHNLRTSVFKKLLHNEQIAGLAHSSDSHRLLNYMRGARHRSDFVFYDGSELNFLNNPSSGGVISISSNVLHKYWKEVVNSSLHPDDSRKEDVNYCKYLWDMREKLKEFHSLLGAAPVALIKAALKHAGIISSDAVVGNIQRVTDAQKERICAFLDSV